MEESKIRRDFKISFKKEKMKEALRERLGKSLDRPRVDAVFNKVMEGDDFKENLAAFAKIANMESMKSEMLNVI